MKRKILESLVVLSVGMLFLFPTVSSANTRPIPSKDTLNVYHWSDEQRQSWENQHPSEEEPMNNGQSPHTDATISTSGPLNSSWPMYCHDVRHTGQSTYSTDNTTGVEKWRTLLTGWVQGCPVIDKNSIIYIGCNDFYALYSNGTVKWKLWVEGEIWSAPVIDENGIIYVGSVWAMPNFFYAFYPNGTVKWKYVTGDSVYSSPAIGNDGTIYFGQSSGDAGYIKALFPNGTLRWEYHTNGVVLSSPAIGSDGTVYCGSHDGNLYSLYPNNGTVKWKFGTGGWVRTAPCIAEDGTIYCVSLDNYLYAVSPNGTMKWRTNVGAGTSPTIGQDGTIYAGWSQLYAVNPVNGSVKWIYNSAGGIEGGTPCSSQEGIIYFGTYGGYLIAVNPNGTEAWKAAIGQCQSAPAIGEDGTIYIGAMYGAGYGCLYAFGRGPLKAEANGPYKGVANQPIQLTGTIFGGTPPYSCHWDFGDGNSSEEQYPTHTYNHMGNFTLTFMVTDSEGNQSSDTSYVIVSAAPPTITITKPVNGIYLRDTRLLPFFKPFIIGTITIQADATQEPYGIDRVEFYIDDDLKATNTETPYQWTWNTPAFFKHTIRAVAYDTSGKSSEKSIDVTKFF